jgi:hypothetical protein
MVGCASECCAIAVVHYLGRHERAQPSVIGPWTVLLHVSTLWLRPGAKDYQQHSGDIERTCTTTTKTMTTTTSSTSVSPSGMTEQRELVPVPQDAKMQSMIMIQEARERKRERKHEEAER